MKKNNIFLIFVCMSFVLLIFLTIRDDDVEGLVTQNDGNIVGYVTLSNPVEQSFISEGDGLTRIDLLLATWGRVNNSNVFFEVQDKQGNQIFWEVVNAAEIKDNALFTLDFDTIENSGGETYKIRITSDTDDIDNAITAWASSTDVYTDGQLWLNGNLMDFDISLKTYYSSNIVSRQIIIFAVTVLVLSLISALVYNLFLQKWSKRTVKYLMWIMCTTRLALSITAVYNKSFMSYTTISSIFNTTGRLRLLIFFMPSLLCTSFLFFNYKSIGDFLFNKRWIIAGIIFIITVSCNLNVSNVSMWNEYVQPNIRTELSEPILGVKRSIRSDEWLCNTPWRATGELVGYGSENNIVRGAYNSGLSASGLYLSYSALANPYNWGYYLFGFEYGTSFYWMALLITSFMFSFELCYIVAKRNRLYALLGGAVLGFSQFLMWWSIPITWVIVPAIIVCIYYYCDADTKWKKILLALGVAFSCSTFVVNLYPAWQVPLAYFIIAFVVWILIEKWQKIKKFTRFDWLTIAGALAFLVSIVACYLYDNKFYIERVMTTSYPGQRICNGGWGWQSIVYKALLYPPTLLYPIKDIGPSELGTFFSLFPIPIIITLANVLYQVIKKIKGKKNIKVDMLSIILIIAFTFLFVYSAKGFPEWLSKVTLMSYSSPRAYDVAIYICSVLMIRCLSAKRTERVKLPYGIAFVVTLAIAIFSVKITNIQIPDYMPLEYIIFIVACVFTLSLSLFNNVTKNIKNGVAFTGAIMIAVCGITVNPVTCGVDALKSKPASFAVQEIVHNDPNAIWATVGANGQFIIANGGRCISSVNYIPNVDLWNKLDPNREFYEVYNRYAHIGIRLTQEQTSFSLLQADSIILNLNYSDIEKCKIKYFASVGQIYEESNDVDFNLLYNEDNFYIYQVIYL